MVRESLARKFHPAGFEQPEGSGKNYVKPRAELQEAFDRWMKELPDNIPSWEESEAQYKIACESIQPLGEIPYRESNSLLADFNPKTEGQKEAGLFISACYTHSFEDAIVFDVDAPEIDCIGYRTNKNIFNNGKVGAFFASFSSGLSINNGECGDWFAWYSSGFVIAIKEPEGYGWKGEGRTIRPADCERIPELKRYMEELSEITRSIKDEESAKRFLERYGPEPKEKIEHDIKEMLKKGGFEI